jgi:hypothetical protein
MRIPDLSGPVLRSAGAVRPPFPEYENSAFYEPDLHLVLIGKAMVKQPDGTEEEIDVFAWDEVPGPSPNPNDPQRWLQPVGCGDWCYLVSAMFRGACLARCR